MSGCDCCRPSESKLTVSPFFTGFLYGYDIGATSFVLEQLTTAQTQQEVWWNHLATWLQGLLIGAVSAGALLGSHVVLFNLGQISRRRELQVAALLYGMGLALNVASGTILQFYKLGGWILVLGRLLFGMGVGFVMRKCVCL